MKVNIAVLSYHSKDLLAQFLPSILVAAARSRHDCRVTVVDNCSTDGSEAFVRTHFPTVRWWPAKSNRVLCSYNEFAAESTDDILILLNNDIRLEEDFVDPMVEPFLAADDVLFVASHGDCSRPLFLWGVLSAEIYDEDYQTRIEKPGRALSAGIGAFDRLKFLELGGYDDLYLPGRYEDIDLCYRGWKRGWKGIYQPLGRKDHVGGVSFSRAFSSAKTEAMVFRNGVLFMVKNIRDPWFLTRFALLLPVRLAAAAVRGRWHYFSGLSEAVRRLPAAFASRARVKSQAVLSDRDALRAAAGAEDIKVHATTSGGRS